MDNRPPMLSDAEADAVIAGSDGSGERIDKVPDHARAVEETLVRKGGVLLAAGKRQVDVSFRYAHLSADRLFIDGIAVLPVLAVGEISSENVKRDVLTAAASLRYGLRNDLQWELTVPYMLQYERISRAENTEDTDSVHEIGDVSTGLFYHWLHEDGARPDILVGLTVKSDTGESPYENGIGTGTGHWAVQPNISWVKTSDPAILFGSFSYSHAIDRDIDGYGHVEPGDTYGYGLGMAFALNYQVSLDFQFQQSVTEKVEVDGQAVPGSFTNAASLSFGVGWVLSKSSSVHLGVAVGLTEDSEDMSVTFSVPWTF